MNSNSRKNLPSQIAQENSSSNNIVNHPSGFYPEELLEQSGGLDLKEFITVLTRRKKLILTTALITALLAILVTLLMPPTYRAHSTLKVERYAADSNVDILNAEASRSDRDFFETQIQLIQSRTLARRVIDQLNIAAKDTPTSLTAKIKQLFGGEQKSQKTNSDQVEMLFLENLTVKPINNSQLLTISYDSADPQLAADINNAIAKTFVRQNLERRFDTASSFKSYVTDNIETTRKSLETAEAKLNDYARENGIVQDADGQSTSTHALKKYAEDLVLAESERIEAEATYNLALKSSKDSAVSVSTINDPYILSLKKAAARLETKYLKLNSKRTRSARRLRKQIDNLRDQIVTEGSSINSALYAGFLAAKEKETMLRTQFEKLKNSNLNLQGKNTKYNRLKREVEINQLSYDKQLEQLMAVNIAGKIGTNNISIIDQAGVPSRKFKPSLKTNLAFGLLLGLLLGMGIAFLREFIDDSLKDSDALEKLSGLPVLTQLPAIENTTAKKLALQTALEPRSTLSESIRSLRTSLRFSTRSGAPQSIFITSSAASEGKSTIALNLATAYAQTGNSVLLIDADLRNPSIHKLLELENNNGLTNFLTTEDSTSKNISHNCMIKNLNVITSGPIPPDPVELLSGNKMVELLESAAKEYDHIIIDGPPILGLADALVLSNLSEATIVAVEAGKTRKTTLLNGLKRLERANANIIGSVLTKISKSVNPEYDQTYYSYSPTQTTEKVAKIGG
jgi:capsular exopolysaccharide synthesis family protein